MQSLFTKRLMLNVRLRVSTRPLPKALFRSKKFLNFDTVALLFLFDKHCPVIE